MGKFVFGFGLGVVTGFVAFPAAGVTLLANAEKIKASLEKASAALEGINDNLDKTEGSAENAKPLVTVVEEDGPPDAAA